MSDPLWEVAEVLWGGGGHDLISKMNPTQSDVAAHADRKKRALTAGLSAIGATAGAAGLGYAAHKTGGAYRAARVGVKGVKAAKGVRGVKGVPGMSRRGAAAHAIKQEKLGAALVPLEVAGLGGEVMATRILHGDTKKKPVAKGLGADLQDIQEQAGPVPTKRSVTRAVITNPKVQKKGMEYSRKGAGTLKKLPAKVVTYQNEVEKVWSGEFSKIDNDKQQVFGWASVIEVNGEPVVDLQGDYISADEMEKAGYEYVVKSRKGGDMHLRNEWEPIHKSDMIESFIVTPEKREAMGLPDSVPTGWWVGFQIQDPEHWADIKTGKRTGFSIHGHGRRS